MLHAQSRIMLSHAPMSNPSALQPVHASATGFTYVLA